jgi:hypothetical protein
MLRRVLNNRAAPCSDAALSGPRKFVRREHKNAQRAGQPGKKSGKIHMEHRVKNKSFTPATTEIPKNKQIDPVSIGSYQGIGPITSLRSQTVPLVAFAVFVASWRLGEKPPHAAPPPNWLLPRIGIPAMKRKTFTSSSGEPQTPQHLVQRRRNEFRNGPFPNKFPQKKQIDPVQLFIGEDAGRYSAPGQSLIDDASLRCPSLLSARPRIMRNCANPAQECTTRPCWKKNRRNPQIDPVVPIGFVSQNASRLAFQRQANKFGFDFASHLLASELCEPCTRMHNALGPPVLASFLRHRPIKPQYPPLR